MLKALGRIRDAQLVQSFIMPVFSLGLFVLFFRDDGLIGAIYAFLAAIVITWLAGLGLWHYNTPQLRHLRAAKSPPLLRIGLPFMSIQAMNTVNEWADVLVLGMFAPAEQVGVYAIAKRFTVIVGFVLIAVNSVAAPRFALLHAQGDQQALRGMAISAARLSLLAASPLLLLCLAAPQWVMSLFGEGFKEGWPVLLILSVGQLVNVATGSVGQLLAMSGEEKKLHRAYMVSTVISIVLLMILTPFVGMYGAAISAMVGVIVVNLLSMIYVARKFGFYINVFANLRIVGNVR
jgi:O-antigen/teichoic acid export membrane protein